MAWGKQNGARHQEGPAEGVLAARVELEPSETAEEQPPEPQDLGLQDVLEEEGSSL